MKLEDLVAILCERHHATRHISSKTRETHWHGHQLQFAAIGSSQGQQILRQEFHATDLGSHVLQQVGMIGEAVLPVAVEQVRGRPQNRQGRTQFVRGIRDKLLLPPKGGLDRNEGAGQEPGGPHGQQQSQTTTGRQNQQQRLSRGNFFGHDRVIATT